MVSIVSSGGGGRTYSISVPKGPSLPSMEQITRPSRLDEVLQKFADIRVPEPDDVDTDVTWGKPAQFAAAEASQPTQPSYVLEDGAPDEEEQQEGPEVRQYTEIGKNLEEVRVENPEDPEQYIITKRRTASVFQAPDDALVLFVWDNSDL